MIMNSENIVLSPLAPDDIDFMLQLVTDPDVTKYIPGLMQDRSMLEVWLNSLQASDHEYVICLSDSKEKIGECSLTIKGAEAEVGFMILPVYWQKGYGTEAVTELLDIARRNHISIVKAITDSNNAAAIRLLEKAGFQQAGIGWALPMDIDDEPMPDADRKIVIYEQKFSLKGVR